MKLSIECKYAIVYVVGNLLLMLQHEVVHGAVPPIPRPAPLQSPKAASVQKVTPMAKVSIPPSTEVAPPIFATFTHNINIDGCDTNSPDCLTWDQARLWTVQKANHTMTFEFTDKPGSGSWAWIAMTGAAPYDRTEDVYRLRRSWQRTQGEVFRTVQTPVPTGTATAATGGRRLNPAAKGWYFK